VRHGGPWLLSERAARASSPLAKSGPRGGRPGLNSASGRNLLAGLLAAVRLKPFRVVGSENIIRQGFVYFVGQFSENVTDGAAQAGGEGEPARGPHDRIRDDRGIGAAEQVHG